MEGLEKKNALHLPQDAKADYEGCIERTARFLETEALIDRTQWKKFVEQFREQVDGKNHGWRGEYWGKMMRGAVVVYEYTRSEVLYDVLTETVRDLLTVAEADGRVSSYDRESEFCAWDMWCRKYVLLGMQYYHRICRDEALKAAILTFLCRHADYILSHIGAGEGKLPIVKSSSSWRAINSCSILEPMIYLYRLTGEKRYFDFATYIVDEGGADGVNIFANAYENRLYPYQYGTPKAYELCSCFEGLLEYYYVTGKEQCRVAAVNFGRAMIESEESIIGSLGCSHELLDHGRVRQTMPYDGTQQETCVTVTWMRYCARLLRLTGDVIFADCIENSFYNAYLGALNTRHCVSPYIREKFIGRLGEVDDVVDTFLPFDSYAPLLPGKRGIKVGGNQLLFDRSYYGCCACIGAAGLSAVLENALVEDEEGLVMNFYEQGTHTCRVRGAAVSFKIETAYPVDGRVALTLTSEQPLDMTLKLRVPAWSIQTRIESPRPYGVRNGYAIFRGTWEGSVTLVMNFDMRLRMLEPLSWEEDEVCIGAVACKPGDFSASFTKVYHKPEYDAYRAVFRGPLTLCADSRLGKAADSRFSFRTGDFGFPVGRLAKDTVIADGEEAMLKCLVEDAEGGEFALVDYASAGKDWESIIAAWLPV